MPAGNGTIIAITLLLFVGRHRQKRTDPALHLASRCHGRSDAGIRADPCCDHGDRRHLHDRPLEHPLYIGAGNPCRGVGHRPGHRPVRRDHRDVPERYQESAGLFDHQPAGVHVPCPGCRRLYRRDVPPHDPRLLQGFALPGRRQRDPCDGRRTGHPEDGRVENALPKTYLAFLVGTLAIAGIPPLSGFFSKDEILAHVFAQNPWLWALAVAGA